MQSRDIVDRYLAELHLERSEPGLDLLTRITRSHVATLPFSSIGPRLGDALPLEPASLLDRIVVRRRGGYCFEQNGLLHAVLDDLGFVTRIQLARVIHNRTDLPGLTHRVVLVDIDETTFVADVGFGPLGPPVPVAVGGTQVVTAEWSHRVIEHRPGEFHLQRHSDAAPESLYRFDGGEYGAYDCEIGHFYSHRHPGATFVNTLVASRILDREIRSLRNREYWVLRADGDTRTTVGDARHLRDLLSGEFGLQVSEAEALRLFDGLPLVE